LFSFKDKWSRPISSLFVPNEGQFRHQLIRPTRRGQAYNLYLPVGGRFFAYLVGVKTCLFRKIFFPSQQREKNFWKRQVTPLDTAFGLIETSICPTRQRVRVFTDWARVRNGEVPKPIFFKKNTLIRTSGKREQTREKNCFGTP
jgi:hypothetical protein